MFTPEQIRPLLEALSHSDAVIVGGQAINRCLLALGNAREFLAEQTANPATHPVLVRWAQRLRSLANDQLGLEAAQTHGIDYQTAVPAALWRDTPGAVNQFIISEWEPWRQEVREKVNDLVELESWLRRLREGPPGP